MLPASWPQLLAPFYSPLSASSLISLIFRISPAHHSFSRHQRNPYVAATLGIHLRHLATSHPSCRRPDRLPCAFPRSDKIPASRRTGDGRPFIHHSAHLRSVLHGKRESCLSYVQLTGDGPRRRRCEHPAAQGRCPSLALGTCYSGLRRTPPLRAVQHPRQRWG